jgi:hypothetical protein
MKIKQKILSALLLTALSAATIAQENKNVEVSVENNNGIITKHITVNGVELDEAGIAELEADGNVKIIRLDGIDAEVGDVMTLTDLGDSASFSDTIQISINTDGDDVTKMVTMNGKELSSEEIAELEASGQMQSFTMNSDVGKMMNKVIFIKSGDDNNDSTEHEVKVITKTLNFDSNNKATLGFMANIKKDGWHVLSVIENSGAQEAGLLKGDVIKFMGGVDLTNSDQSDFEQTLDLVQKEEGDMVDLDVERNGQSMTFIVEARNNESADLVMNIVNGEDENSFTWVSDIENSDMPDNISVMVMKSDDADFDFNFDEKDIHMVFPDNLADLKMFIAQGNSTSKLLGKNNKLSTLSEGLADYFNTDGGVLVLKAGDDNVFNLQDGDVIKSINGNEVDSPKDVIKQLLIAGKQEDIKLEIFRHKRNKTLKYNK